MGDIMVVSRLALKVIVAYKGAPGDYRNISDEVESLHIIIKKAAQHFKSTTLSDNSRQEGQKVLKGCQNVLEDLDTFMEKYNSLASSSAGTSAGHVLQRMKLGASQVLGTEDIATLRARLTSNTTLLNGFIQRSDTPTITINYIELISLYSCDSNEVRARLDHILGLHRTTSRNSFVSLAGSVNTKQAFKRFIKGLFAIGVTADMINEKEKEIQDILKSQHPAASSQISISTIVDADLFPEVGSSSGHNQLPEVGNPSHQNQLPELEDSSNQNQLLEVGNSSGQNQLREVGNPPHQNQLPGVENSSNPVTSPVPTMSAKGDFLVGPSMLTATEAGNTAQLIFALEHVKDIDFVDDKYQTALHKAAAKGDDSIVQLLLSKGASIEARDFFKSTPLHRAAENDQTSTVELLLSKGASIEARDISNWTPLHCAARYGHTSTVELLLSKRASIKARDTSNWTPLHCAACYGNTSTVELLLSKGASIEAWDGFNGTPLHYAACWGQTSTVELLFSKRASIKARDISNMTPLHYAAWNGQTSTVELLLSKGASIEARDDFNWTPLHCAALYGQTSTVELLLSKGASIAARNTGNRTPLDVAISNGNTDIAKLLQNKAADLLSQANIRTAPESDT